MEAKGRSVLKAAGISLSFGRVQALMDVYFEVYEDEILAIIGPNGACKTSMLNWFCPMACSVGRHGYGCNYRQIGGEIGSASIAQPTSFNDHHGDLGSVELAERFDAYHLVGLYHYVSQEFVARKGPHRGGYRHIS